MPLDPDAAQVMDAIKAMMPVPGPGTDAAQYRAISASNIPREPVPLDRVKSFSIDGPGGPLPVRFYANGDGTTPKPTMLYFHGGGFVICSIETHDIFCRRIAKETGWAVLSVDYRLAPEHPYPAAVDDGYAALEWAASPAGEALGIDPLRIAVGGDSAGGAISAALTLATRDRGGPEIVHQLLIYPVIDNRFDTPSYVENGADYFLTAGAMRWFWEQYLGDADADTDAYAAPGRAMDLTGLPPATVISAGYDPLRDEAADYAARLAAAGVETRYRCFDGAFHGFAGMEMLRCAQDAMALIAQRLKAVA